MSNAQVVSATLQGTVHDATGATLSRAIVQAVDTSTGVVTHTETNTNGRFVFASLAPGGPYTITVEAPGFSIEDRSGIHLQVNQVADISIFCESEQVHRGLRSIPTLPDWKLLMQH